MNLSGKYFLKTVLAFAFLFVYSLGIAQTTHKHPFS